MNIHRIITRDKEIYEKMNLLNFSSEIVLKGCAKDAITKMVKTLNKDGKVVHIETLGNYTILKKLNPLKLNVCLRK